MAQTLPTEYRNVTYRLLPGSRERARRIAMIAGACRFVWNQILADQEALYSIARMNGARPPSPTFFTLGRAFTQLRNATPWLRELPYAVVRYTLKHQADAWLAFFRGHAGRPRFKGRYHDPAFTIPQNIRIEDGRLRVPTLGWLHLRRRGGNPYPEGEPKSVAVRRIGGKWYAVVCYEIAAIERPDNGKVIGLDMNAGQVATSEGEIIPAPDTRRLEARLKRYSRKLARQQRGSRRREKTRARLAKTHRRIAMKRRDWQHHVSRRVADAAHTVCIEDLNTKGMTARGGAHKHGLNRVIRDTGWSDLRAMLEYKAVRVIAVDPAYTSQTCAACGAVDSRSRRSQAIFKCVSCGHADHADLNASVNIRRRGLAHLHGDGALPIGTPVIRETDQRQAA